MKKIRNVPNDAQQDGYYAEDKTMRRPPKYLQAMPHAVRNAFLKHRRMCAYHIVRRFAKGDMTKEEMVAMARSIFEEPHPLELKYAEEEAKSDSA